MKEKVLALLESADFMAEIEKMDSTEEVLAAFRANGVEVTFEELQTMTEKEGELDLEALDNVAGGIQMITTRDIKKVKALLKKIAQTLLK